jgi:hypothetical protein
MATRQNTHVAAPFEVGDNVMGIGIVLGSVLRLEPVRQVVTFGDRREWRPAPPVRSSEPPGLHDRRGPEPRLAGHGESGRGPEPNATRRAHAG